MSNATILTVLGFLGLASIYLSLTKEDVKESFGGADSGGMPSRTTLLATPVVVPSKDFAAYKAGKTDKLNFQALPAGMTLGSSPVVSNNSFVSYPNYQQSIPQPKPSVGYSMPQKVKPATYSEMGVTEKFQCGGGNKGVLKEGFTGDQMIQTSANPNPKQGCGPFASGNYNEVLNKFSNPMPDTGYLGEIPLLNPQGENENYMVFERLMTTGNARANRASRASGAVDFLRGDCVICPDTTHYGWFSAAANPGVDLSSGALSVMGGKNQADDALYKFMKDNGKVGNTFGGYTMPDNQQFLPQSMESYGSGFNGNTLLTSFS